MLLQFFKLGKFYVNAHPSIRQSQLVNSHVMTPRTSQTPMSIPCQMLILKHVVSKAKRVVRLLQQFHPTIKILLYGTQRVH